MDKKVRVPWTSRSLSCGPACPCHNEDMIKPSYQFTYFSRLDFLRNETLVNIFLLVDEVIELIKKNFRNSVVNGHHFLHTRSY